MITPSGLTAEQKDLLRQFAQAGSGKKPDNKGKGKENKPKGFFNKIKDSISDNK